ncbi:hypothetical protein I35_4823 [Burkholderia cenocepacia H111]|nr:hypothetical protein I35_4823 [Burkholderia cenocepacia H111]
MCGAGGECACPAYSPPVFLFDSQGFGRAAIVATRRRTVIRQAVARLPRDDRCDRRTAS